MAVLNPDHLIEQAERLLAGSGAGAPRQVDLRRAISGAYYAVFHAIAAAVADDLVGPTRRDSPQYALAYRSIDHRSVRAVCEELAKATRPAKYARYQPSGGFASDLKQLAAVVVELREAREKADYDSLFRATAAEATFAVEAARISLQLLKGAARAQQKVFLALIVFPVRRG